MAQRVGIDTDGRSSVTDKHIVDQNGLSRIYVNGSGALWSVTGSSISLLWAHSRSIVLKPSIRDSSRCLMDLDWIEVCGTTVHTSDASSMSNECFVNAQTTCGLSVKASPLTLSSSCRSVTISIEASACAVAIICLGRKNDLVPIASLGKQVGTKTDFNTGSLTLDNHPGIDDESAGNPPVPDSGLTCNSARVVIVVSVCGDCSRQLRDKSKCAAVIAAVDIPTDVLTRGFLDTGQVDLLVGSNRNRSAERVPRFDS